MAELCEEQDMGLAWVKRFGDPTRPVLLVPLVI